MNSANPPIPFLDINAMNSEVRRQLNGAWQDLMWSGEFVRGHAVGRFERMWAEYCGTSHAVGVANGTDAIWLALRGLGVGLGDEVIVPANTFVATVEAIVQAGAAPRFADVDPETLLLTPETLTAALTPRTRAAVVVHLYGQVADMDALDAVARRAGVVLVEDAAQAHGAQYHGRRAGSLGAAGCFSFYPGKNLGAFGDGGAVVTSDDVLAERIRELGDHGRRAGSHDEHVEIGVNSRLDTLQAAVLAAKLPRLDAWNEARREHVARYRERLDGCGVSLIGQPDGQLPAHHLAVVRVPERDRIRAELARDGIPTRVHYPTPCHRLKPYAQFGTPRLPVAERASREILSLPLSPHMTSDQVDRVAGALQRAMSLPEAVGV